MTSPGYPRGKTGNIKEKSNLAVDLVSWYRVHHRRLPWRAPPGQPQDPYRAWLAEVMLQQTTVITVTPYYQRFLDRWPDVHGLAAAAESDVLAAWAGLGYYSRARNLHRCAQTVSKKYKGIFPNKIKELEDLPGIGPYTSAALYALAFGGRVVPVDGNIERVMARLYTLPAPPATIKPDIKALAQKALDAAPNVFPGDYAQALMDLGATICTPRTPNCKICPVARYCKASAENRALDFPVASPKKTKPERSGIVYILKDRNGAVLGERRPDQGLFAGMIGLPTTGWDGNPDPYTQLLENAPKLRHIGDVRHSFTHFDLTLKIMAGDFSGRRPAGTQWVPWHDMGTIGLPKLFAKVIDRVNTVTRTKKA